jgi:very-short-patch-repair endonuclease
MRPRIWRYVRVASSCRQQRTAESTGSGTPTALSTATPRAWSAGRPWGQARGMPATRRFVPDLPPVFLGSQAVQEGLLTPAQLRGPLFTRVLHGVYRPSSLPDSHGLRCLAACLVLPECAAVTGRSAATVLGVPLATTDDDVDLVVPEGCVVPRRRGIRVREASRAFDSVARGDGLRLAEPHRVAFDAGAGYRLPQAVAIFDAMARGGLLDPTAFARWLDDYHGAGVCTVRDAVPLIDARAESQQESVMRVALVLDGIPVVPQYAVVHRGRLVARVDLGLPQWRLAIEYDGTWHVLREQLERDRLRLNRLNEAGWTVLHVTAVMLRHPNEVVAAVRAAMERSQISA